MKAPAPCGAGAPTSTQNKTETTGGTLNATDPADRIKAAAAAAMVGHPYLRRRPAGHRLRYRLSRGDQQRSCGQARSRTDSYDLPARPDRHGYRDSYGQRARVARADRHRVLRSCPATADNCPGNNCARCRAQHAIWLLPANQRGELL